MTRDLTDANTSVVTTPLFDRSKSSKKRSLTNALFAAVTSRAEARRGTLTSKPPADCYAPAHKP